MSFDIRDYTRIGKTYRIIYYHGFNSVPMFTYTCGLCGHSIGKSDRRCPGCRRFIMKKGDVIANE